MTVDQVLKPVKPELKLFQKKFRDQLKSKIPIVDTVARFIIRSRGKNLRPALVLLSGRCCSGSVSETTYYAAMTVELIHTATLIHDDVVDGADMRRSLPSVNSLWNNKTAVLMGDYLLANALICMADTQQLEATALVAEIARRASEGELLQNERSRKLDMDEATYFQMIADKTGALISCSCELGAITTGGNNRDRSALRDYGLHAGIAFQIRDDLFDFTADQSTIGKTKGRDLKERNLTLPILHALNYATRSEVRSVLSKIRNGLNRQELRDINRFVGDYGGLEYAQEKIDFHSGKAIQALAHFQESEAKTSLIRFIEYNRNRNK